MKINLAKSAGFCFGVKRALDIAFKTATSGAKVYMLGDIVHNEDVVRQTRKIGIKKIKRLTAGKNKTLLLRAHGTSRNIQRKAERLGYKIVDATCPMVKEIHKIAQRFEQKNYRIIVIGDKKHDEVYGIIGQLKSKAIVIDPVSINRLRLNKSKQIPFKSIKKACVVVQSTQELEKVLKIVEVLKTYIPKLEFFNTICRPTQIKQAEIKTMPLNNDIMIIIGSKKSANTKRLYEIAKSLNKQSYWVNSKKQIKPEWLKGAERVGITAGASTPDYTTQDIINYIKQII